MSDSKPPSLQHSGPHPKQKFGFSEATSTVMLNDINYRVKLILLIKNTWEFFLAFNLYYCTIHKPCKPKEYFLVLCI